MWPRCWRPCASWDLEGDLDPRRSRERDLVVEAMIVARILEPASKLRYRARGLGERRGSAEHLGRRARPGGGGRRATLRRHADWLFLRQEQTAWNSDWPAGTIHDGSLVLYDELTSTYFEGRCCPLAQLGHPRDGKKDKLQIVFGLRFCSRDGCPVRGRGLRRQHRRSDDTLGPQLDKVRQRFGLNRVVMVGDRGMLTSARLRDDFRGVDGLGWISALRTTEIRKLFAQPGFQFSLFDRRDMVELHSPDFPGERLIACWNPLLAAERSRKRESLLQATEKDLDAIVEATKRSKNRLQDKARIALRIGKIVNRYKVAKHFVLDITDTTFSYRRDQGRITSEASLGRHLCSAHPEA